MRRTLVSVLALLVTLLLQLTVLNRLPLPGGAAPDLMLVTVAALAVTGGPMAGTLTGFFGGLALDIAPPGSHLAGSHALVFCLVGYCCGVAGRFGERAPASEVALTAAGAVAGEALQAGLGLMVSDPQVSWPIIRGVLPAAVAYELLLSPFVLWLVGAAAASGAGAEDGLLASATRPRLVPVPSVLRPAGGRGEPKLRLAGTGTSYAPQAVTRKREPKLRLGEHSGTAFFSRTGSAPRSGHRIPGGGQEVKVNFSSGRKSGLIGGSTSAGRSARNMATRPKPAQAAPRFGQRSGGLAAAFAALRARASRRRTGPGKGWLSAKPAAPKSPQLRSPGKGWLKAKPARRSYQPKSPGHGWLGSGRRIWRGGGSESGRRLLLGGAALGGQRFPATRGSRFYRRRGSRSKMGGYR